MPTRTQSQPVKIIADLDDLTSQRVGFKFNGKQFIIEPMTTENFIALAVALNEMDVFLKSKSGENEKHELDEVYEKYYELTKALCHNIKFEHIKSMTVAQLHALMHLIIRHVTGQTQEDMTKSIIPEDEKKKIQSSSNSVSSQLFRLFAGSTRSASKK